MFDLYGSLKGILYPNIRDFVYIFLFVAQKMAELPLDAPEAPLVTPLAKKKFS